MARKKTSSSKPKSTVKAAAAARPVEAAVHRWPSLEVFSPGDLAKARKAVENRYGKAFASKASDRLSQALATVQQFALEASAPQPRPIILECTTPTVNTQVVRRRAVTLAGTAESVPPAIEQVARRHIMRDEFIKHVAEIAATLQKRVSPKFPAGLEAIASPTVPSSVVEICWLNWTMRTYVDARGLRDIADEKKVAQLDLPRQLQADINGTAPLLRSPGFRKKFSIDGAHITVAVIDTEVDLKHPALANRVVQKTNFTNEHFGTPAPHATAVAGIIASADKKFTGIAPGVSITNYKVLATDPALNADDFGGALALQQALEDGAQIANCSWGAGAAGDGTGREAVACNNAWDLGLTIVKSAGNLGPGPSTLTTPADADGVIVVGAVDREGKTVQDYSSRGPAAKKVRPHLVAPGGSEFDQMHSCRVGGKFGSVGEGTSYAAPHVTGVIALLLAQTPGLTPDELRKKVLSLCTPLEEGDENMQGKGLLSMESLT